MRKFFYPTGDGLYPAMLPAAALEAGVRFIECPPFDPFTGAIPLADGVAGVYCEHPALAVRCLAVGVSVACYDERCSALYVYDCHPQPLFAVARNAEPAEVMNP